MRMESKADIGDKQRKLLYHIQYVIMFFLKNKTSINSEIDVYVKIRIQNKHLVRNNLLKMYSFILFSMLNEKELYLAYENSSGLMEIHHRQLLH